MQGLEGIKKGLWRHLGPSWGHLGADWKHLGGIFGFLGGPTQGRFGSSPGWLIIETLSPSGEDLKDESYFDSGLPLVKYLETFEDLFFVTRTPILAQTYVNSNPFW